LLEEQLFRSRYEFLVARGKWLVECEEAPKEAGGQGEVVRGQVNGELVVVEI
jgi:hypothetical protein